MTISTTTPGGHMAITIMDTDIYWVCFVAAILFYPILLAFYRVYFHPLAKFPGPKLAAATGWYETGIDLNPLKGGTFMETIGRMHDKYGPIVRINPHEIHVQDPTWLGTLYSGPSAGKREKYAPFAKIVGTPKGTFGTVSHDLHRLRRAAINPMFSKAATAAAAPTMYAHIDQLLSRMDEQIARDGFAEMRTNYLAFATENVLAYTIGQSKNLLESEEQALRWRNSIGASAEWTLLAKNFVWALPFVFRMPLLPLKMVMPDLSQIVGGHRDMEKLAIGEIKSYQEQQEKGEKKRGSQNIFQTILSDGHLPLSEKAPDRMAQEAFIVVAAGGETTARAMATATYFLLSNKDTVLPRLEEELKTVMPDPSSQPPVKELERLPWLTGIIKESLRIMALFTSRLPVVSPDKPFQYKDWYIPAGTPVSMSMRDILLNPDIYENPSEFHPERWLPENPNLDQLNHYFVPFSRGNRTCAGTNLAYAELYIVLASLFRRRKLELHDTIRERDVDAVRDCFIGETARNTQGIRVKYTKATV